MLNRLSPRERFEQRRPDATRCDAEHANGEDEREHPVVPSPRVLGKIVGTEPLPMAFVIRGSVKEETVMDRQENSVLEAGWLLAVPLSIGFAVLIAGLVLG
ncbi:hypothetical protein [Mesorhizobium prunaredense]|jgi:hypothetical protein|uniref:hypothetical protein n=1 Tax=Mesorhizobium prunaredense TaxID=1631249 RepID=UPI00142D22E0|nr:hypothetical protein [Mesorhizobium prunaredense]